MNRSSHVLSFSLSLFCICMLSLRFSSHLVCACIVSVQLSISGAFPRLRWLKALLAQFQTGPRMLDQFNPAQSQFSSSSIGLSSAHFSTVFPVSVQLMSLRSLLLQFLVLMCTIPVYFWRSCLDVYIASRLFPTSTNTQSSPYSVSCSGSVYLNF